MTIEHLTQCRGEALVILALDLGIFVDPASRAELLNLRGRKEFDNYLESLNPGDPRFVRDPHYVAMEQRGYELGVFNRVLAEDNFAPTYRVVKERFHFPPEIANNVQFKKFFLKVWHKWEIWLRLSSNGIITIILKIRYPKLQRLIDISHDVMGLQGNFDMASARQEIARLEESPIDESKRIASVRQFMGWVADHALVNIEQENPPVLWQVAVEVVQQFIAACGGHLHCAGNGYPFDLHLTSQADYYSMGGLRDQYTVFHWEEVSVLDPVDHTRKVLLPRQLLATDEHAQALCGLLEGVLIRGKNTYYYPKHSPSYLHELTGWDRASWENELCILGDRCAVIYPYNRRPTHELVFSSRQAPYADYWSSVLRGIEFGVETRLLAQLTKQIAAKYLADGLLQLRGPNGLDRTQLRVYDQRASNLARLTAHLRTITSPSLIANAGYAVSKFELFMHKTHVPLFLDHAQANLADLNALLQRNHDLYIQVETQRLNELALIVSAIFASLTMFLGFLAFPSFFADLDEATKQVGSAWGFGFLPVVGKILMISLPVLGLGTFLYMLYRWVTLRWRRAAILP
jgi:hypothetical protein